MENCSKRNRNWPHVHLLSYNSTPRRSSSTLLEGSLTHSTFVNVLALLNFSQRSPDSFVTKLDPKTWVSASVGFQLGEF